MNKVIAVDVDLTVVDTLTPWLKWFKDRTGKDVLNEDNNYSLIPEMTRLMNGDVSFHPLDFWKQKDLYDFLKPLPDCVEVLKELHKRNWKIIFVSSCISEHIDSKIRFLDRYFRCGVNYEYTPFISTHDKHYVRYDLLIDDKAEHYISGEDYNKKSQHILFTGVRDDSKSNPYYKFNKCESWDKLLSTKFNFHL